jgi:hypothetical protein
MSRERDLDALAEAIAEAQGRRSWLGRQVDRAKAAMGGAARRAIPFGLVALAITVGLRLVHVDPGSLLMPTVMASPFLLVAVASFVVHAWRQNTGLTYTPPATELDLAAEPGQPVGQPAEPGQVGQVAKPVEPTTVTVTVLPTPVAALPKPLARPAPSTTQPRRRPVADIPRSPTAKRHERRRLNRLARIHAALDAKDEVQHLTAAYEYARATIKRMPPESRDAARRALAELIVNYTLNDLDADDITRLEPVA